MSSWTFHPADADDLPRIADLKVMVIREHLERLCPWSEDSARQYLYDRFVPENTRIIEVDGAFAGCVALRQAVDCRWLEQFYLVPRFQGQGLGGAVLSSILAECDLAGATVRLDVLRENPARRLYERHGFVHEHDDQLDIFMVRAPRPAGSDASAPVRVPGADLRSCPAAPR